MTIILCTIFHFTFAVAECQVVEAPNAQLAAMTIIAENPERNAQWGLVYHETSENIAVIHYSDADDSCDDNDTCDDS